MVASSVSVASKAGLYWRVDGVREMSTGLAKATPCLVGALRVAVSRLDQQVVSERERQEAQERLRRLHEEASRSRSNLEILDTRLKKLAQSLGVLPQRERDSLSASDRRREGVTGCRSEHVGA